MMTKLLIIYILISFLFTMKFKKFLMTLISIEILMLITSLMLMLNLSLISSNFIIIYFLIFMVSESVLGLSLLIMMSRIHGNDSMQIMNMIW
uniref:NADH dehydrogenase subunit 4L n=1 Tax=Auplopus sp. SJW-2017 TaxID=1940101 RepID=A0A1P8VHA1_9HYME|nr:NADH dehydrogenase subunit 4L [Auplopus sp. SJW-2017]